MKKTLRFVPLFACLTLLASCGGESTNTSNTGSSSSQDTTVDFDTTQEITPLTRDTNSGTREAFFGHIDLEDAASDDSLLTTSASVVASNGDMISNLATDEYAIGYFSFDSITSATDEGVKVVSFEGVTPSEDTIVSGEYSLTRHFNYIVRNDFGGDSVKETIVDAFVAYMGTAEGLNIIQTNGGVVDPETINNAPTWSEISANYPGISDDHSNVTINFGGSTSVEEIARQLSASFSTLAGNFIAHHDHTGSGAAYSGTQGDDAGTLDIGFLSREFNDSEVPAENTSGVICTDAVIIGVNEANPLTNITADQCHNIYALDGTIDTWDDILG